MEALAVTASVFSVVSLFIQLAEKVQQLHDFWSSFQEAPLEIQHIASDLQAFSELISETITAGARSVIDNDVGSYKVLERCDSKVENLKQIIEGLEPGFTSKRSIRRKWTAFKVVMRKNKLHEFKSSLGETKIDLILLNQYLAG